MFFCGGSPCFLYLFPPKRVLSQKMPGSTWSFYARTRTKRRFVQTKLGLDPGRPRWTRWMENWGVGPVVWSGFSGGKNSTVFLFKGLFGWWCFFHICRLKIAWLHWKSCYLFPWNRRIDITNMISPNIFGSRRYIFRRQPSPSWLSNDPTGDISF